MTQRRTLVFLAFLTFLAFSLSVLPLDSLSMWRDEIDTLCFALDFWEALQPPTTRSPAQPDIDQSRADRSTQGSSEPGAALGSSRPSCQPTPGLSRVDPLRGFWPTLRNLLTLPGWNGPLYTILMRPWIGLTGYSPFALRFSSLMFGLLAVALTYVLGRRLFSQTTGLIGATLVTLSPHLVWYSQEAKMYSVILTLALLAIYGLRRAIDSKRNAVHWWGLVAGATTAAFYCHILTVLLIPLEIALGLLWWPRTRQHWRGALATLASLTLPYTPLLRWQARNWLLPPGQATLFDTKQLSVVLESTFNGWAGNFVSEPWATLILAALVLLALFGLAPIWLTKKDFEIEISDHIESDPPHDWREALALLFWIALPILGIWLISARQPLFTNRYLIWVAPALYLAAGAGVVTIAHQGRGGTLAAGVLMLVVLTGDSRALLHQTTQPIKPDFQSAAAHLKEKYQPGDLVIFHLSYMKYNFDFYFPQEYDGWGAPAPGIEMSESDVDFYMRANTDGHRTVWLVLSEPEMWDPRGLVKAWLDAHALATTEEQIFTHVRVFRYQLNE